MFFSRKCSQPFTPQNSHAILQNAENLPKIIDELLEQVELFDLLQPYIDDYFEKLNFEVINGLNGDKLKAISHLGKKPLQAYLIGKSDLLHRFREGVVHMETAYAEFYQLFVQELVKPLRMAQPNPKAHQHRVRRVKEIVNLFAERYTNEYNKIRKRLFPHV